MLELALLSAVLRRELRQALSDPRRFLFLFGAAIAYVLIFGALYAPNVVTRVPCVLYDADQTALSRDFLKEFESSDALDVKAYAQSREEMERALAEKDVYVAVELPAGFSRDLVQHGTTSMLYLVNGSNIILTNLTSSAIGDITIAFSDKVAVHRAALAFGKDEKLLEKRIAPVKVQYRVLGNPTQGYLLFFLVGLAMAAFQQGIFFSVGASVLYEKENQENVPTEFSPLMLLLGKGIFYWFFSLLSFLLVLLALCFLEIPLRAFLGDLFLLAGFFSAAAIAFIMLFASFFSTEAAFIRAIILYPVIAFILSGYTWPALGMDEGLQLLAQAFPLTHFANTARELFLVGASPHYASSLSALATMGILCFLPAVYAYGHSLKNHTPKR